MERNVSSVAAAIAALVLVSGGCSTPTTMVQDKPPTSWQETPAALLDVFPESVVEMPQEKQGKTELSSTYAPSGSSWGKHLKEGTVFHYQIKHTQDEDNSFAARIGKGGQLYSLRGAFGESVPPQGIGNPWNDEVWQFVSVCSKYNGLDSLTRAGSVPDEILDQIKKSPYSNSYFIHNSGAYMPARVDSGTITLSCDVMLDKERPGELDIILRDTSHQPWQTFGTVRIAQDGITCNERPITGAQPGVWYSIEIRFQLDARDEKQPVVTVRTADGLEETLSLPPVQPPIRAFTWLGLSAAGNEAGVINVDNLVIRRVTDTQTEFPVNEGFEDYTAGQMFGEIVHGRDTAKGADAFVTDRMAATGRHSLEIHDAAGLTHGWQPMVRNKIHTTVADNLYCPLLGATVPDEGKTYRTVNWGIVPQLRTIHRSPILYYVQTRDVGNGVIELTYVVHNFSARDDIEFNWLNAPWGGTRTTSLPHHFLSSSKGELWDREKICELKIGNGIDVRKTGGWNLSCASEAPDSPSLALVFGRDRHLDAELRKAEQNLPHCQYDHSIYRDMIGPLPEDLRTRPEHTWRNYDPAVVIPRFRLAPGTTIWYRSFLIVNRRDRATELAKSLVEEVDYGLRVFDPESTPMVPVHLREGKVTTRHWLGRPIFELFAKPVPGTMPVFLIENAHTGRDVITTDPYIFVPQEKLDLRIPPEHPHYDYYSKAIGYSMDKNNSNWKRLLGYGYVDKPTSGNWAQLSSRLAPDQFPERNAWHLDLWVRPIE